MIRAVFFDFDGLILDTEVPEFQSWQEVYQNHGCTLTKTDWAVNIGLGADTTPFDPYENLVLRLGRPIDRAAIRIWRKARFQELMAGQSALPGVVSTIQTAKELGLKIGVASSSSRAWVAGNLERLGLLGCFDAIKTADDVTRTKPDPELYLALLDAFGLEASEAIALEDSPNGSLAAKRAGLFCVAIPTAVTEDQNYDHVDLRLRSLEDLPLEEWIRDWSPCVS